MSIENILILAVLIVLAFILIRFLTKVVVKLLIFAIIVALIAYVLFYWNGGIINLGKHEFIIYELEQKYCYEKMDTVKCDCIILPLKEDIESKYSAEELDMATQNRQEAIDILMTSIRENQDQIRACLKENNAGHAWKEFIEDLKDSWVSRKFRELWEKGEEEVKEMV